MNVVLGQTADTRSCKCCCLCVDVLLGDALQRYMLSAADGILTCNNFSQLLSPQQEQSPGQILTDGSALAVQYLAPTAPSVFTFQALSVTFFLRLAFFCCSADLSCSTKGSPLQ